MPDNPSYMNAHADPDREARRLGHLEAWCDPTTERHLEAIGVTAGWRCLDVGAGRGSVARLLAERVGPTGSVLAVDIDTDRLGGLPPPVTVRRLDLNDEVLPTEAFDLVHCRALLMHQPDATAAFARLAAAVAPGGWLLVEEGDFGLFELSGSPDAAEATGTWHALWSDPRAARIADAYFGRRVPGMVGGLGWEKFATVCVTDAARPGEPAFESLRLAWPEYAAAGRSLGVDDARLATLGRVFQASDTLMTTISLIGSRVRRPERRALVTQGASDASVGT